MTADEQRAIVLRAAEAGAEQFDHVRRVYYHSLPIDHWGETFRALDEVAEELTGQPFSTDACDYNTFRQRLWEILGIGVD